ncbi:hypothetical protein HG702_22535 (plasmid) [Pectobacterium versatile]|nr:hypothetical protein HG702_22535 [Pectobacterium versatile]
MTVDAGNMIAVAQNARAVWPDSSFIFCADNDHLLKNPKTGEPENKGIISAQKAAELTNGEVIAPAFNSKELAQQLTDFNDLDVSRGRDIFQHVMNVQLQSIGIQTPFNNEPQIRDALSLGGFVFTPAQETTMEKEASPGTTQMSGQENTSQTLTSESLVSDSPSDTTRDTRSLQEYERDIQKEGKQIAVETQKIQQDANNLPLSVSGDMRSIGNSVVDLRELLSNGDISQTKFNRLVNDKVEDFSHSLLSGNYSQADINYTTSILHEIGADKERQSRNSDIVAYSDVRSIGDKLSTLHKQVARGDMTRKEFDNELNKLSSEFNRSLLSGQFSIDDFNYTTKIITDIHRAEKNDVAPLPSATTSPSESNPTAQNEQSESSSKVHVETKDEELKISASPVLDTTEKSIPGVSETLPTPALQATAANDVAPLPSATTSPSESTSTAQNEQSESSSKVHVETKDEELKISASPVLDTTEKSIPGVSETLPTPAIQATAAIDTEIPPPSPEGVISEIGVTETNRIADLFKQTTPTAGEDKENEAPDLTLKSTAQEKPNVSTSTPKLKQMQ